jgi:hypothetical protein
MDELLSSLCHACGQCQEQSRESHFGLIAFDRSTTINFPTLTVVRRPLVGPY